MGNKSIGVDVRLGWPVNNMREGRWAHLEITDRTSGIRILTLDLEADEFTSLMASGGAKVTAEVPDLEIWERVGKRYVREDLPISAEMLRPHYPDSHEPTDEMLLFAARARDAGGWDGTRWNLHNWGWSLSGYKYVAVEES